MNQKKSNVWGNFILALKLSFTKEKILAFLKQRVVTTAIKKIATITSLGGVKGWLANYIVEYLYDEVGQPVVLLSLRKLNYTYEVIEGKVLIKKLDDAKRDHDQEEYDSIVDDILS